MPASLPLRRWRALLPLLLGGWLLAGPAQAQPEPIKFGQIDKKDLTAEPFAHDSAAAVILCDYGTARIASDDNTRRQLRFDRTTRIKILKKAGLNWANVEVLLRHEAADQAEQLSNLRGCTYNLVNGAVVAEPLASASVFTDKVSDRYSVQKFGLPNVREGSVIEFSYTIVSDYVTFFRDWQFQHSIPVRWSEFRAAMPHHYTYKIFLQSKQPLAVDEKADQQGLLPRFRWAMRDVPALRREPYMTTTADYVDELTFELADYGGQDIVRSWEQIDHYVTHDRDLGQQLDQHGFLKADLARLPARTPTNALARVAAVRALVCAAVKCTGEPGLRASEALRTIYQTRHLGTAADVNFLLIAALRGAGFAAHPVLLSTRAHGRVRATVPQINQFNYVAAHVRLPDGQELVLDATDPLLPYDMLPERCLNQQGRLLLPGTGASRWIALTPRHRHTHFQQVQLRVGAAGELSGQVHEEYGGYAGAQAREELAGLGEKKYAQRLAQQHPAVTLATLAVANRDSLDKPLALDYAFAQAGEATAPLGTIYVSPLRDFGITQNPFQAEQRTFPVDFGYAQEEILVVTVTLPAGYALSELPKAKALNLPEAAGRFVCSATATGGTVQLSSRLTLRKPIYSPAEYGQLRELYRLLLEKQAEQLVIKKAG